METIDITVYKDDVEKEVAKATDYTGSKLITADGTRDLLLMSDEDLTNLVRFWEESVLACNENFKEMLISGSTTTYNSKEAYRAKLEVSKSFDKVLQSSVESTLRSFFIASIVGQWFSFSQKEKSKEYIVQAAELLESAERLLYSRKKPQRPTD